MWKKYIYIKKTDKKIDLSEDLKCCKTLKFQVFFSFLFFSIHYLTSINIYNFLVKLIDNILRKINEYTNKHFVMIYIIHKILIFLQSFHKLLNPNIFMNYLKSYEIIWIMLKIIAIILKIIILKIKSLDTISRNYNRFLFLKKVIFFIM